MPAPLQIRSKVAKQLFSMSLTIGQKFFLIEDDVIWCVPGT